MNSLNQLGADDDDDDDDPEEDELKRHPSELCILLSGQNISFCAESPAVSVLPWNPT